MAAEPIRPIATVDAAVFSIGDDRLSVLLHKRPEPPFRDVWALPGGYVQTDADRDTDAAMRRILTAKTGVGGIYLEQLATFSGPARDPRGWSLSVAHLALVPRHRLDLAGTPGVALFDVDDLPPLAFDHDRIVAAALARLRGKGVYSTLPVSLLGREFTLAEAQHAYEIVLGARIDQSSFRRKVQQLGIFEETGRSRQGDNKRPAKLYRLSRDGTTFDRSIGTSPAG